MSDNLGWQTLREPVAASGGVALNPDQAPSLRSWYDFTGGAYVFQDAARTVPAASSGDVIGGVTDRGPAAAHLSQATAANKGQWISGVQNGRGAILFDGVDDVLTGTWAVVTAFTLYMVVKWNGTVAGVKDVLGCASSTFIRTNGAATDWEMDTDGYAAENPFGVTPTTTSLLCVRCTGTASAKIAANAAAFGAAFDPFDGVLNDTNKRLGSGPFNFAKAYVMELAWYDAALTDFYDVAVRAGFNSRWNIYA